jgi:AcrR family transcriptional regulator
MLIESSRSSRAAQKARTRQALLDAAIEVINENGLEATTARAITDRAGVASGTFFVHFPEVPALLDELLDQHLDRVLTKAYRSVADGASLVESLVHVADALFAGYQRQSQLSRAFLSATLLRVDQTGPTTTRLGDLRAWVLDRMLRARASGEIPPSIDVDLVFDTFFCLYIGLVIGGLRNDLDRHRQRSILSSALRALVGGES